jgi:6-pyruvoyl-tetrahydropterin synthase
MQLTILAETRMFTIAVTREFCAAHAIVIAGVREPLHGHNFRVTATLEGESLDGEGLLCDFHLVERELEAIMGRVPTSVRVASVSVTEAPGCVATWFA